MNWIIKDTPFEKAQDTLKNFLHQQEISNDLIWLFREDVISDRGEYFVKVPIPTENQMFAQECYELGRSRGFGVALHALCLLEAQVCCYIRLPENELDAQYKLISDIYVKYSVTTPIESGRAVRNPIVWRTKKWNSRIKKHSSFIDDIPLKKTLMAIYESNEV